MICSSDPAVHPLSARGSIPPFDGVLPPENLAGIGIYPDQEPPISWRVLTTEYVAQALLRKIGLGFSCLETEVPQGLFRTPIGCAFSS